MSCRMHISNINVLEHCSPLWTETKMIVVLKRIFLSNKKASVLYKLILMYYFHFIFSDGELYSATVSDFSGSDPLIYKRALESDQEPLRTDQFDSKHLNCK